MNKFTNKILTYLGLAVLFSATALIIMNSGENSPAVDLPEEIDEIFESDHAKGNPEAKVILIEYSDYECPACAYYESIITQVLNEFGNHIYFAYRHYPLDGHQNAKTAIRAAEAADLQGKFWEMHTKIFANQNSWKNVVNPEEIFASYAAELGLDTEKFKADYNSTSLKEFAEDAGKIAQNLGLSYTPTFILNGKVINNPRSYEEFRTLLRDAIKNADIEPVE